MTSSNEFRKGNGSQKRETHVTHPSRFHSLSLFSNLPEPKGRIDEKNQDIWVTKRRLCGLLEACLEELPDVPFYYHVMKDFGIILKSSLMKIVVLRSAIINAGYRLL